MIEIEIDGKKLTAKPDQTVIQVADEAGIYIPRFCYHKHLSIPANCRMCLVEVEKAPKALPACATPVMNGMKVFTKSQKTIQAQRAVMEFLLINHPLDCPICDQGGECELQDLAMGYGASKSQYNECKRAVADENLGPLIATEMTRCILCSRCIRFGDEIAGIRELGMTFRGEHEEVSTFVEQAMTSEVSGNIIDLCPVGALTSKPFSFTARAWELEQATSISPHDCIGSNLNIHTRYGKVMRVVSRENNAINQTFISDRDRFSYAGLYHEDRIEQPMIKTEGEWRVVEWQDAFYAASESLKAIITEYGADQVGALASPNSTTEEFYLLQKLMRALGSQHIDHRLRESDTKDQSSMPAFPGLGLTLSELQESEAILLIGSNLQKEQPIAALRVRKAGLKGAAITVVNPVDYAFNFKVSEKYIAAPHLMIKALAEIIESGKIVSQLKDKKNAVILLGALAFNHPQASTIRSLANKIADLTGAKIGYMTNGGNGAGGWLAGAVPNNQGLNAYEMLQKPREAYVLLNVEPNLDCANPHMAKEAFTHAKSVIALSMYRDPMIMEHADIIFPIAAFTETSGTFVNTIGEWQSFKGVAKSFAASRPAWKVLRAFANFLGLDGFTYESSEEVKHELKAMVENMPAAKPYAYQSTENHQQIKLSRIGETPIYAVDSLTRRSKPLQDAQVVMESDVSRLRIHPETAQKYQLQENDVVNVKQASGSAKLSVSLDSKIAKDAVWIASGIIETSNLGDMLGEVEIEKA